jgi:hypothetical protein
MESCGGAHHSEEGATLDISEMSELPAGTDAHVYWRTKSKLLPEDVVRFRMIDADAPTDPREVKATDSPQYLEEQRQFEEFEKTHVRHTTPAERLRPTLGFRCSIEGTQVADAVLAPDEEHILCSISWDCYKPTRTRVFVRSFSRSPQPGTRKSTEWLRMSLLLNEAISIEIHA